jgi:septal ring-binding cell division protein DamX
MGAEKQLRNGMIYLTIAFCLVVVILISVAWAAEETSKLTDTAMWAAGTIFTGFAAVAAVLRKHENSIATLQSNPLVHQDICDLNVEHNKQRFARIEAMFERSEDRHNEILQLLREMKP